MAERTIDNYGAYYREAGSGENILCLHSSAGSSKQWQALMEQLAGEYHIVAADLIGYGGSPGTEFPSGFMLDHEVSALHPLLEKLSGPLHLIGHSYGGAVALHTALTHRERISSLTIYEPVLFSLLFQDDPQSDASREIRKIHDNIVGFINKNKFPAAARIFVEFWSGGGSWELLTEPQREKVARKMPKVMRDFEAVFNKENHRLSDFAVLDMPVMAMVGDKSPLATRRITELLARVLPNLEMHRVVDAGHMGPAVNPVPINNLIARFFEKLHAHQKTDGANVRCRRCGMVSSGKKLYEAIDKSKFKHVKVTTSQNF